MYWHKYMLYYFSKKYFKIFFWKNSDWFGCMIIFFHLFECLCLVVWILQSVTDFWWSYYWKVLKTPIFWIHKHFFLITLKGFCFKSVQCNVILFSFGNIIITVHDLRLSFDIVMQSKKCTLNKRALWMITFLMYMCN